MARAAGDDDRMTDVPPTRYKVIEQGRRLVVIDRMTGQPVRHDHPARPNALSRPPARLAARADRLDPVDRGLDRLAAGMMTRLPATIDDRSGRPIITTSPLYDAKGPRSVILDEATQRAAGGATVMAIVAAMALLAVALWSPWSLLVPAILAFNAAKPIRRFITARIDALDQANADSASAG